MVVACSAQAGFGFEVLQLFGQGRDLKLEAWLSSDFILQVEFVLFA